MNIRANMDQIKIQHDDRNNVSKKDQRKISCVYKERL